VDGVAVCRKETCDSRLPIHLAYTSSPPISSAEEPLLYKPLVQKKTYKLKNPTTNEIANKVPCNKLDSKLKQTTTNQTRDKEDGAAVCRDPTWYMTRKVNTTKYLHNKTTHNLSSSVRVSVLARSTQQNTCKTQQPTICQSVCASVCT